MIYLINLFYPVNKTYYIPFHLKNFLYLILLNESFSNDYFITAFINCLKMCYTQPFSFSHMKKNCFYFLFKKVKQGWVSYIRIIRIIDILELTYHCTSWLTTVYLFSVLCFLDNKRKGDFIETPNNSSLFQYSSWTGTEKIPIKLPLVMDTWFPGICEIVLCYC